MISLKRWSTALLLFLPAMALAQADRIGSGGSWEEGDLKHCLARLGTYLASQDGRRAFPEVVEYDLQHPEKTVEQIAFELNPRLVQSKVVDAAGNERDCVSYHKPVRYFECRQGSLPAKPEGNPTDANKSEYYGSLYRLVFHELLVQVGIENPVSKEIPSEYPVSARLMVHLEAFPEWVPGAASSGTYAENEIAVPVHLLMSGALILSEGIGSSKLMGGIDYRAEVPVSMSQAKFRLGIEVSFEHGLDDSQNWIVTVLAVTQYDLPSWSFLHPYLRFGLGLESYNYLDTSMFTGSDGKVYSNPFFVRGSDGVLNLVLGTRFGSKERYFADFTLGQFYGENKFNLNFGIHF